MPMPECRCTRTFKPVCGVDGVTYKNECLATCKSVAVAHKGGCQPNRRLSATTYKPVCAKNGTTYKNIFQLKSINKELPYRTGPCPAKKDCICNKHYKPVCGVDGVTYGNTCEANCASMHVEKTGAC